MVVYIKQPIYDITTMADFKTIHTRSGLLAMASAEAA